MQFSHYTERCTRCPRITDLFYCRSVDEYLCEDCIDQLADQRTEDIKSGKLVEGPALLRDLFNR
jgi:uncharacterized protein YlaI